MAFPGAARVRVDVGPVIKVNVSRLRAPFARAGSVNLTPGDITVAVTFTTPPPSASWVLGALTVNNWTDNQELIPDIAARLITAPSTGGFTVRLSVAPPAGTSYVLHWAIAEVFNP